MPFARLGEHHPSFSVRATPSPNTERTSWDVNSTQVASALAGSFPSNKGRGRVLRPLSALASALRPPE